VVTLPWPKPEGILDFPWNTQHGSRLTHYYLTTSWHAYQERAPNKLGLPAPGTPGGDDGHAPHRPLPARWNRLCRREAVDKLRIVLVDDHEVVNGCWTPT